MSKITEFNLVFEPNINNVNIKDIEVNIYKNIQFNRRLEMLSDIINESADDTKYYNIGKLKIFFTLFTVQYYTDIEMEFDSPAETYDALIHSGVYDSIVANIDSKEIEENWELLLDTIEIIYKYNNSIMGVIDALSNNYKKLELDANAIHDSLADPETLGLLKDIMTKLG